MKLFVIFMICIYSSVAFSSKIESMFDDYTSIPKPFELRDPFQKPKFKSKAKEKREMINKGVWNDEQKLNEAVSLDKIDITGVLIGKERRVLIKINNVIYQFKEEETLGRGGPKIKAILPGGIILVEQIDNIYGEPEYIETVVPISQ